MMSDAADDERGVGHEVKPVIAFCRIGRADRVLQAGGKLARPVLRGGQLDEQLGTVRLGRARAFSRCYRGGEGRGRIF